MKEKKPEKVNKREQDKKEIARRLANTNDGIMLLKYYKQDYLYKSPIDKGSVEMTYFNLGFQHFVKQGLLLIDDTERLERMVVYKRGE